MWVEAESSNSRNYCCCSCHVVMLWTSSQRYQALAEAVRKPKWSGRLAVGLPWPPFCLHGCSVPGSAISDNVDSGLVLPGGGWKMQSLGLRQTRVQTPALPFLLVVWKSCPDSAGLCSFNYLQHGTEDNLLMSPKWGPVQFTAQHLACSNLIQIHISYLASSQCKF